MVKARALALFAVLALLAGACDLPRLDDQRERPLAQTSSIYASDGSLITDLHATENRVILTQDQMPQSVRDATVAIEDRRFYDHGGVDVFALARALAVDIGNGGFVEGGSTITQQLAKNLYTGDAQNLRRKIDEAALAVQMENRYTKDEILTDYLNTVYFGEGAYGIEAAAETYFGVHASELDLSESATLAGLITAPNHFDPFVRPASAEGRRDVVLRIMEQMGTITHAEHVAARREPITVVHNDSQARYPFPYFVDYFKRWFLSNPAFGKTYDDRYRLLFTGGLRITTTLDPAVQAAGENAVRQILRYPGDPDAAITVVDPRTGYVRAMIGGRDKDYWANTGAGRVNLATDAGGSGRQTGSAFKAFALVAALEHGYSPDSTFAAPASITLPLPGGGTWNVTNAEGQGYGTLSLRTATEDSVNTVYAQLIQQLGPDTVVRTAEQMGMRCCTNVGEPTKPLLAVDSAVLGSNEANTLEMASAYGTLATGGKRVDPIPVESVVGPDGSVLWQADPKPDQVVDPQVAAAADDILQDVVLYGTGTAANIGRPQIGKTGTDDNHDNAWFVGAVPQLSAAVWVGFHEGQIPMEPPRTRITVFGGTWPAQIWRLLMEKATSTLPPDAFPTPEVHYVTVAVDATQDPACLPNEFTPPNHIESLNYVAGTEPTQTCTSPTSLQSVLVPSVIGFDEAHATAALTQAGFYVKSASEASTQPRGTVIYQDPAAGTSKEQTSTVTITVARPPAGA
ncbi:MAG TPA: transglycosylase domain-containing protein [Actinomycetota bacterium]|jgi:penicillin-binding protein 1A|nr:transglycosylase domain-containing protein [Actinomycetota bacterium]